MKSRCCYVCGETDGYIARNCPQRKGKTEYIGKEENARTLITKSVHTTSMSAIPDVAVTKSAPEGFESWIADSASTEHITPDPTALKEYKPAAPGDMVEVADKTSLPVQGYGALTLELQQPGGITVVTLQMLPMCHLWGATSFPRGERVRGLENLSSTTRTRHSLA